LNCSGRRAFRCSGRRYSEQRINSIFHRTMHFLSTNSCDWRRKAKAANKWAMMNVCSKTEN
jgi:hypothetical protein